MYQRLLFSFFSLSPVALIKKEVRSRTFLYVYLSLQRRGLIIRLGYGRETDSFILNLQRRDSSTTCLVIL